MRSLVACVLFLLCPCVHSQSLAHFPRFDPQQLYQPSNVVRWHAHLWIAIDETWGQAPAADNFDWLQVPLQHTVPWQPQQQPLGTVVQYQGLHYVAVQPITAATAAPEQSPRWRQFNHPALGYSLPLVDPIESRSVDVDRNDNGLRDDFEAHVLLTWPAEVLRQAGFNSGYLYHDLLQVNQYQPSLIDREWAQTLSNSLAASRQCQQQLHQQHPQFSGFESKFFNTAARLAARAHAEQQLILVLGEHYQPQISPMPCEQVRLSHHNEQLPLRL